MGPRRFALIATVGAVLAGCMAASHAAERPEPLESPGATSPPSATSRASAAVSSALPVVALDVPAAVRDAAPAATVGVAVFDLRSGLPAFEVNADRQFRSASLVKLLIAVDDLHRNGLPRGRHAADLRRMLALSDDAVASRLWVAGGGDALVTRTAKRLRLTGTEPPDIPGRWGNVLLTANDVVRVYRHILEELPAGQRELIVAALTAAPRVAADGWDQYFGIPGAIGGRFAVKQGWSDSAEDFVVHSTGLVGCSRTHIVVLLVSGPPSAGWDGLRAAATAAAREVEPLL